MIHILSKHTKTYSLPTDTYFGRGITIKLLKKILTNKTGTIAVVIGEHLRKSKKFLLLLKSITCNNKIILYNTPIYESNFDNINNLTKFLKKEKVNIALAIGGGTIIDTVKSASILAIHCGLIEDYVQTKKYTLSSKGIYFIAIPTTSGTGSEVTPWATVWGNDNKKYSLASPKYMFPDMAIVDPEFTDNLPPLVSATTGIDALCQAIEAYWNINFNRISSKYALSVIRLISKNIKDVIHTENKILRNKMAKGSLYCGLAFSNTQTTICHAISYPITSHWKIAHGQAVSITMPYFLEIFLMSMSNIRRNKLLLALNAKTPHEARQKFKRLMKSIGLKTRLSELGIPKSGIELIVAESFYTNRANNTPTKVTPEQVKEVLVNLY
jgi:alcohol dehydrogenase class IV